MWLNICIQTCIDTDKVSLQETNVAFLEISKCVTKLPDRNDYGDNISERMICLYDKNVESCHGDSG